MVSGQTFIERGAENLSLDPAEAAKRLDQRCCETSGLSLFDFPPQDYGAGVTLAVFMAQLRRDFLICGEKVKKLCHDLRLFQKQASEDWSEYLLTDCRGSTRRRRNGGYRSAVQSMSGAVMPVFSRSHRARHAPEFRSSSM